MPPVARLADEQDGEGRGQRLRQDREVGAADPAAEGREAEQPGQHGGRQHDDRQDASPRRTRNGSHQPGSYAVAGDQAMKSGSPPGPASASLRCIAIT